MDVARDLSVSGRLCIAVWLGIAFHGCSGDPAAPVVAAAPLQLRSMAELGKVAAGSGSVSRQIVLQNRSGLPVRVSHWATSCECLRIEPASIELGANERARVRVCFDASEEGFSGDLLISVEAMCGDERIGAFEVPVCVVTTEKAQ